MKTHAERPAHARLGQEIVRIIQSESQYRSAVRRVLAAERRYSKQAVDPAERRVMRVEAAKMLFYAAIDKGAAFRTVESRFREVLNLPCGYLPSEVVAHTEFAAYCGSQGRAKVGIRRLEQLRADLEHWEGHAPKRLLAYCRGQVGQMLRALRKRRVAEPGDTRDCGR
jgi:hypothetical protein